MSTKNSIFTKKDTKSHRNYNISNNLLNKRTISSPNITEKTQSFPTENKHNSTLSNIIANFDKFSPYRESISIKDSPNLRPREKILLHGVKTLQDEELISIILGTGIRGKSVYELANQLAYYLKSISDTPEISEIAQIPGLGEAKACQILACLELSSRFLLSGSRKTISKPEDLLPQLAFLKTKEQEHMVCVCLDGGNQVLEVQTLTIGLANQTQIHPREAFRKAIQMGAVSVLFAHNHPSGSLRPSPQDLDVTRNLVQAGCMLEIPVLDHIIVSREGYTSIKASHSQLFRT